MVPLLLGADQLRDCVYLCPYVENVALGFGQYLILLTYATDKSLEFLELHEVVALIDRLVLARCVPLLLELLVALEVDLFGDVVLGPGKLLDPQVDCLLQLAYLLFETLYFLLEHADMLLVLLVLLEHSRQLLLLDHQLVQHRVVVYQVAALQLRVPFEVAVVLAHLLYFLVELLALGVQRVEKIGP